MNIVIVGCGKIGRAIVADFISENHDIVVIDNNPEVLDEISNIYDVMTVIGTGADSDTLREANIEKCDLFIATTSSDENNMLICFLAQKMGAKNVVARIRNPEFNDRSLSFMKQQLNIQVSINPELLVAKTIFNILKLPSAAKVEIFSGRFEMVEIKLSQNSVLDGITIKEMREKYNRQYLICAVQRDGIVTIPGGNFVLKSGDSIGITADSREIQKLFTSLGIMKKQARSVMILGGGKSSYYLAKMLTNIGISVKIIDKDIDRCKELSALLPSAVIINGDGSKQELLLEEGINEMDAFVSLTGMDEENILISIFAFLQNVPKVIPKVNKEELISLAEKIGLETVISPLQITSNILLRYARALENSMGSNVETLYKLMDGKAEALQFHVVGKTTFTDIPLRDLKIKKNILIAGIVRDRKTIIPYGNDVILPNDKVIVLAAGKRLQDLSDIIE